MKIVEVKRDEKGLLFKGGKLQKILGAGKYRLFGDREIETLSINEDLSPHGCPLESVMALEGADKLIDEYIVGDNEIWVRRLNGDLAARALTPGRWAFWKEIGRQEFRKVSIEQPEVTGITRYELQSVPVKYYTKIEVKDYETARLYYDNKFVKLLGAGTYFFWIRDCDVRAEKVDMRGQQLTVSGQEILTADKVGLRVNFVLFFRITDAEKIAYVTQDIGAYLYTQAQLVLREYISRYKTDEILENRDRISDEVITALRERTADACAEITGAGIKDIILPGEISAIMNSVLAAEKRAQANVITRREEVASTRSLMNTAKLLDENATLRRLKELEYLERITEHVGEITVDGRGDLLTQLTAVISGTAGTKGTAETSGEK